jgi:hypothetical protein
MSLQRAAFLNITFASRMSEAERSSRVSIASKYHK